MEARAEVNAPGFNSLQTGKRIQSHRRDCTRRRRFVSIPFKRESGSKVDRMVQLNILTARVSIPFKRESGSKDHSLRVAWQEANKFQFPSNGKADPKSRADVRNTNNGTTTFQFPSNGKADPKRKKKRSRTGALSGFQFPSNGKADPKAPAWLVTTIVHEWFQFPSNGKADPKIVVYPPQPAFNQFQFPSNGKADPKSEESDEEVEEGKVSIPFKRESGSKVAEKILGMVPEKEKEFQFPSNGKADPKCEPGAVYRKCKNCFNSLQTGKRIQSV